MRLPLAFAALMIAAVPLMADAPTVKSICEEAPSLEVQRERLQSLARETDATAPPAAADAWLALGRNYEYAGAGDSAIACYRRAIERRGSANELLGATDALLRRSGSGDAEEALGYAERAASQPVEGLSPQTVRARIAWAHFLAGHTEQARTIFTRMERSLYRDPLWMIRMGQVALEAGDPTKAYALLYPVAMVSRGQSDDAMQLIGKVAARLGAANRAEEQIQYDLARRERRSDQYVKSLGAHRVRFTGSGSFSLGGTVFDATDKAARPAIVALVAPDDSLDSWDSLGVRLRDAGFATLFVDARGSGWSVGRNAPLAASWNGRRGAMVDLVAGDLRDGFRALKLSAKIDTTHYTVMASGSMALAALLAAERDPRVQSVVLISPDVGPVERGLARDVVRRIQVPLYLVETTIDRLNDRWITPLYEAAPVGISRVGSASGIGTGPETLRSDAANCERLAKWLKEKKPARPGGSARRG